MFCVNIIAPRYNDAFTILSSKSVLRARHCADHLGCLGARCTRRCPERCLGWRGGLLLAAALVRLAVASAVRVWVLWAVRLGSGLLLPAALVRWAVASAVRVWVLAAVRLGGGRLLPAALVRWAVASAVRLSVLGAVRLGGGLRLLPALVRFPVPSAVRLSRLAAVRLGGGFCFPLRWCAWR